MLNELVDLHHALKRLGCDLGTSHHNFRHCPKGKAGFKLFLDETGKVKDITLPDFNMEEIYRWQEDNHTPTFPAFNARALFEIPDPLPVFSKEREKDILAFLEELKNPRKKALKSIAEQTLDELEARCNDLWDDDIEWISKCLKDTPDTIKPMLGEIPKAYQALEELVRRSGQCNPEELKESVRSILRQKLIETREKIYAEALFAIKKKEGKKRRGKEHGKDYLYLLTIDDWNKYPSDSELEKYPPYHPAIQDWMKMRLEIYDQSQHLPTGKPDAYGRDLSGANENFAPVNVGGLGPTVPFTANDQIPCLERYGLEGMALFPAGAEIREMTYKSMNYILDRKKREGITWKNITKYEPAKNKRKTVVFAYCTQLKDATALQFFDREDNEVNQNVYRSEAATKLALAPFDSIAEQKPDAKIVINLLAAVDPGNTKVLASRKYSLSELSEGAFRWQAGNANIPRVGLPWVTVKSKKGSDKKISTRDAIPVYPIEAIKLLNSGWRRDGTTITQSKRFAMDEALDFLFGRDGDIGQRIETGLSILVEKSSRVIILAALTAHHHYHKTGKKLSFKNNPGLHMLPSLFGLLLYKKGIRKEDYMKENLFYLGRLFAAADSLYIQYHQDIRQGSVPMSLLGNDKMALALQNPQEAFVDLGHRLMHPYLTWVKRVNTDTIPRRIAKKCHREIADLTDSLSKTSLPTEIDDAGKAVLLLGYLSYGAKTVETVNNGHAPEKHNEGEEL